MKPVFIFIFCSLSLFTAYAQDFHNPGSNHGNRFEQLDYLLHGPNEYRTASGAPGPKYWQQRADYDITVEIDEAKNFLTGAETVTYYNNSPDVLKYIWVQLDENFHRANTDANLSHADPLPKNISEEYLAELNNAQLKGLGINIESLTDATGKKLNYTINQTMMRIDLPLRLAAGRIRFKPPFSEIVHNGLGDHRARRIMRAKEQDVENALGHVDTFFALGGSGQQASPAAMEWLDA